MQLGLDNFLDEADGVFCLPKGDSEHSDKGLHIKFSRLLSLQHLRFLKIVSLLEN